MTDQFAPIDKPYMRFWRERLEALTRPARRQPPMAKKKKQRRKKERG